MERNTSFTDRDYLSSSDVMEVLKVNNLVLQEMITNGIVRPTHIPKGKGMYLWKPEEIFRAFLCLRLTDEFKIKYGDRSRNYRLEQIRSNLLLVRRTRSREFLESQEWADVTERAAAMGLNLLDLQKIQLNRGLSSKD